MIQRHINPKKRRREDDDDDEQNDEQPRPRRLYDITTECLNFLNKDKEVVLN